MSQPSIVPAVALPPAAPVRLFYLDDSGTVDTGWIVYSWVECATTGWNACLRSWLDFRKELFAKKGIPVSFELHATKFANGRGNPSTNTLWNQSKASRRTVLEDALHTIDACPHLHVGTVFRQTTSKGSAYARERGALYLELVRVLDQRLGAASEAGILVMDGSAVNSYYDAHRSLPLATRNILEDPIFVDSHRSQWVQMADIVAWSAYQHLRQTPGHFARTWYTHVLPSDIYGGPQQL